MRSSTSLGEREGGKGGERPRVRACVRARMRACVRVRARARVRVRARACDLAPFSFLFKYGTSYAGDRKGGWDGARERESTTRRGKQADE